MLKPQATPPFTKIRLGGMVADLEGYAYQIENSGEKPRAVLWYLSMVGHKTAVQAIWAGLVNSPPQSAVLYREEEEENSEGQEEQTDPTDEAIASASGQSKSGPGPKAVMLQLAEGPRSGGWSFFKTQLNATSAFQGVLLPQIAFPTTLEKEMQRTKSSPTSPVSDSDKNLPVEFLFLSLPSLTSKNAARSNSVTSQVLPQQLYYARLNSLSGLPLHPSWADLLWQRALDSGEIERLEGAGVEIYLCRKPDEELLRQEIADLVRLGKLSC